MSTSNGIGVEIITRTIRGHTHSLPAKPPIGAIPLQVASRRFHRSTTKILELVRDGKVRAGWGTKRGRPNDWQIFVSALDLKRESTASNAKRKAKKDEDQDKTKRPGSPGAGRPVPADGEPFAKLAKDFDIPESVIYGWCMMKKHPGLGGRRVHCGDGEYEVSMNDGPRFKIPRKRLQRGPLASRADIATLVAMIKNPLRRKYAGNPGRWQSKDCFQHDDGRICWTETAISDDPEQFGLAPRAIYNHPVEPNKVKRVNPIRVVWPAANRGEHWYRLVWPEPALEQQ